MGFYLFFASAFFFLFSTSLTDSSERTAVARSTWECHLRDGRPSSPFGESRKSLRWGDLVPLSL